MDKTVKVHEHLEYEIIEQKKTSTIVKDLNTNRSYACFKIDSPIGNKLTLFINKIKENGFPDFQHSILKSYIIGEIYEFDIVEEQEQGFILEDSIKTHICPFKWAVNPGQKKIKLRVRLLNKEKNQLIFELPNQNEELSMKDFLDDFMEKINILRETGNNSYHFPIIDESFVNKHPFLDIINKKYEILNFLNNSSQESILELSHLLITNVEDYEFIKLVLTYNLLDTIKLEEHNSHKILELIYKNL